MFHARLFAAFVLLLVASCSGGGNPPQDAEVPLDEQPAVDKVACGPTTCKGCCSRGTCIAAPTDTKCGAGGGECVDCASKGLSCSGTGCVAQCSFEKGCADKNKLCQSGKCVACKTGTYNCDLVNDCECTTGCMGTQCR